MSNDLISRKEAIESVKRIIQAGLPEEAIYSELEEIPTAYDVDAVCKEIQKQSDNASDNIMTDKNHELYWDGREDGLDEALEIVRNGGKKE